jgi:hypothetical protein
MKTLVVSALALTAMSSVALAEPAQLTSSQSALAVVSVQSAEPVTLTAAQLDTVTAGTHTNILNIGVGACIGACAGPQTLVGAAGNFFYQPE